MATRRENVVLSLDDQLTPGLIRAALAAEGLDRELNKLDGQSVRTSRSISGTEAEVKKFGNTAGGSSRDIDRFSGRVGLLADAVLTLGPAAATMSAVAVPAVAALGADLGVLAVGAVTTKLAFHNLGGALTAFNKASAAPTATNIAAAQRAMDKLPPSAQRFVLELHRLNPELLKLQQSAGAGMFVGLTSGLQAAERDLPLARRLLAGVSTELGTLADKAGHSLASDQWRPFLKFVGQEAPHSLDQMGRAAGSTAHGVAELWMAMGGQNRRFGDGLVELTADFDRWASSVGQTKGFQSFLAYVNENGPRVLELLGEVGITLVDIGTAAAPIGGPVIEVLTSLFQVIDAIAKSDFGTPLLGGLIALRLYSRAAALAGVEVKTSFASIAEAPAQIGAGLTTLQAKTAMWARTSVADIGIVTRAWMTAGAMSEREAALQGGAAGRLKGTAATALKGAGAAAGIAVVASGVADSMGVANTASLALMGTLAGPWGAAVGGAVGATIDLAHANDDLVNSQHRVDAALKSTDFGEQAAAINDFAAQSEKASRQVSDAWDIHKVGSLQGSVMAISDIFTHATSEAIAKQRADLDTQMQGVIGLSTIGSQLGRPDLKASAMGAIQLPSTKTTAGIAELTQLAERAQPAMDALNISYERFANEPVAIQQQDIAAIVDWINQADSAKGKTDEVAKAFAAMGDQSLTAEDRITALTSSLDALFDPILNLGHAADTFHQGLNDIEKSLSKNSKSLRGNSDAAIQNREAIRSQVTNLKGWIEAQANAGASSGKMTSTLKAGRAAIIAQGEAAGLNRGQILHMIDAMHLTPKLIKTIIEANTGQALSAIQSVQAALAGIDRVVNVHVNVTRSTNALLADVNTPRGADGMTVPGRRWPYGDKVLAMVAPGEEVISNRNGQADRFRADRASGRIPHYADGGTVGGDGRIKGDTARIRALQHSIDRLTKAVDADKQSRDDIRQKQQALASSVTSSLRSDLFAETSPWGGMGGPNGILRTDIRNDRRYNRALHGLRNKGLSGNAFSELAASGNLQAVQAEASLSKGELARYEHLFNVRQRLTAATGRFAGDARFGQQLAVANTHLHQSQQHLHDLNQQVKTLNREVAHLRKEQAQNAKRTGDAVGDKVNGSASRAVRRKRP